MAGYQRLLALHSHGARRAARTRTDTSHLDGRPCEVYLARLSFWLPKPACNQRRLTCNELHATPRAGVPPGFAGFAGVPPGLLFS